jgi:hypothetical protein
MKRQRKHNPSSHHMGKAAPVPHLKDHGANAKEKGTKGKAVGNRAIKPAASSVRHPSQTRLTRKALNKIHI